MHQLSLVARARLYTTVLPFNGIAAVCLWSRRAQARSKDRDTPAYVSVDRFYTTDSALLSMRSKLVLVHDEIFMDCHCWLVVCRCAVSVSFSGMMQCHVGCKCYSISNSNERRRGRNMLNEEIGKRMFALMDVWTDSKGSISVSFETTHIPLNVDLFAAFPSQNRFKQWNPLNMHTTCQIHGHRRARLAQNKC